MYSASDSEHYENHQRHHGDHKGERGGEHSTRIPLVESFQPIDTPTFGNGGNNHLITHPFVTIVLTSTVFVLGFSP